MVPLFIKAKQKIGMGENVAVWGVLLAVKVGGPDALNGRGGLLLGRELDEAESPVAAVDARRKAERPQRAKGPAERREVLVG